MSTIATIANTSTAAFHHVDHDGWSPFFPLVPLLFIGLWVALFVVLGRRRWRAAGPSAEEVLAERYARGEIDEAELRERRTVLRRKD